MKTYGTTIYAKNPKTGGMSTFAGPNVKGISKQDAFSWCQNNGLGYCYIEGEIVAEIDSITGETIDYETLRLN